MPKRRREKKKRVRRMKIAGKRLIWAECHRSVTDLAKALLVFWDFGACQRQTLAKSMSAEKGWVTY